MITIKHSVLANKNNNVSQALMQIGKLDTLPGELKYNVTKCFKAYKEAIDSMSLKFQTDVLSKFQEGLDSNNQPNIPEDKQDAFKAAQLAFGDIEVSIDCDCLSGEDLLKVDKITPEMIVGLDYLVKM
jgi:hypothetical protein